MRQVNVWKFANDLTWDWRVTFKYGGIKKGLPYILRREFHRWRTRRHNPNPTLVSERDWDFLLVLDACRWDTFCKVWGEEVPFIYSPGSNTPEWSMKNFMKGGDFKDVVVITTSPYMTPWFFEEQGQQYPFGECVNLILDGWDEETGTVYPSVITDTVHAALPRLSGKRVIMHFMQPHIPWVKFVHDRPAILNRFKAQSGKSWGFLWWMVGDEISVEEAKAAYEDNLIMVLSEIAELVKELKGKIVLTSDHGNLFGEYGMVSHPSRVYVPELIKVPWVELEGGAT